MITSILYVKVGGNAYRINVAIKTVLLFTLKFHYFKYHLKLRL